MEIGTRHSMAGTAVGRALLMSCRPAERESLLNQLQVKETEEWRRHHRSLTEAIRSYPRHGCCVSVGEIYPDVQAVAVPLGRIDRNEPAAINCSFHGLPLDAEWLRREISPQLQALVRQLT
jgi:DNA-binding IclR family transcriptional regulator